MLSALHQRSGYATTTYALDPLDMLPFSMAQRRLSASAYAPKKLRYSSSDSDSNSTGEQLHSATHSCSDGTSTPSTPARTPTHQPRRRNPSLHEQLRNAMGDILTEDELQRRFTFGRILGTGATSKVYSAMEHATGREVAVKVFDKAAMIDVRRSMVADGEVVKEKAVHRVRRRLQKILSELELSKSLDHPNIIKFLGAYETSHRICIVHELVDGGDLLEHLLTHGKMNDHDAAKVFAQLLEALQHCHARNIYHRDLKLENVLLTKDFRVKLIDFGLSEYVPPGQTLRTICGTPLYCSPEVLLLQTSTRELGFHGGPADVWSVGILIFALLTGCAPFDDSSFAKLRVDVHRNRIAYPGYLSNDVKGLLKTLLIHDAHLRPTVADILAYPWIQRGNGTDVTGMSDNMAMSPRTEKARSLSGLSDNDSDTASTSGSYDNDGQADAQAEAKAEADADRRIAEALRKNTEEPHDAVAVPTHLSCLEKELEHLVATPL